MDELRDWLVSGNIGIVVSESLIVSGLGFIIVEKENSDLVELLEQSKQDSRQPRLRKGLF